MNETLTFLFHSSKYKAFKLAGLFPACCLLYTVGFALRAYGAFHYDDLGVAVATTVMIYIPP